MDPKHLERERGGGSSLADKSRVNRAIRVESSNSTEHTKGVPGERGSSMQRNKIDSSRPPTNTESGVGEKRKRHSPTEGRKQKNDDNKGAREREKRTIFISQRELKHKNGITKEKNKKAHTVFPSYVCL